MRSNAKRFPQLAPDCNASTISENLRRAAYRSYFTLPCDLDHTRYDFEPLTYLKVTEYEHHKPPRAVAVRHRMASERAYAPGRTR